MRQLKITKQITNRSEESISRYFQEVSKYPMVTAEEEVDLTIRIREGDDVALKKLVLANLRFVISVAKQFQNKGLAFPDLINEGNFGLVKAAKRFDETRGFKFISYAVWWIRQSIMQALSEQTRIVRLPLNRLSSINKIRRAISFLEQEFERDPTESEIADYLDLTNEEVSVANKIKEKQVSFDKPIGADDNNDFSLYDLIQTGNIPPPDHEILNESLETNVNRALKKLNKQEATILIKSFGLSNTPVFSLNDMAIEYNLSVERVRQIKNRGLHKLKIMLKGNYTFLEY